jgi:hypothetical protein
MPAESPCLNSIRARLFIEVSVSRITFGLRRKKRGGQFPLAGAAQRISLGSNTQSKVETKLNKIETSFLPSLRLNNPKELSVHTAHRYCRRSDSMGMTGAGKKNRNVILDEFEML